ncbi:YbaN family protein [Faucicola boevrei]|uniref:YbaN family protein n=1 Tax=Faucicola boevrei TaxID=346665 RepID=UPI000365AF79|nr:YbaN family protein [Moraxella boevrei]
MTTQHPTAQTAKHNEHSLEEMLESPIELPMQASFWQKVIRWFFLCLGFLFLGIGIIGIVLPVLPTTPFVLLATACFAKSSEKFHHWLINHKTFGPLIKNWHERRAIPRYAKYLAWSMMALSCAMLFYRLSHEMIWIACTTSTICLLTTIWMARLPDA